MRAGCVWRSFRGCTSRDGHRDASISRGTPRLAAGGLALAVFGGAPLERPTSDSACRAPPAFQAPPAARPRSPSFLVTLWGGGKAESVALSLNLCPWGALR